MTPTEYRGYTYCQALRDEGIVPASVECCISCHRDMEYRDEVDPSIWAGCEVDLPDGRLAFVCCSVATWLKDHLAELPQEPWVDSGYDEEAE